MILQIHRPASPLDRFVEHIVYYDGLNPAHNLDRFLPDGNTELIVNLSELPQHIYDNQSLGAIQTCRQAWVSGVRTQPITIPSGKGSRMLIVAFKRGKAFPFYPCPMDEFTDRVVEADLVFGRAIHDLRDQLLAAGSVERMFERVEIFLLRRAGQAICEDVSARCVDYALSSIVRRPALQRLDKLSDAIGYSQKHFISLFRGRVGVPPKQYMRVMRFQQVVQAIESAPLPSWSRLARECGFYDQAHFIHDFRAFSGFTPSDYLERKAALLNYIPVA